MKKDPHIIELMDAFSRAIGGPGVRLVDILCATCGSAKVSRDDFIDDISLREFDISGMCQECQDKVFSCQEEE